MLKMQILKQLKMINNIIDINQIVILLKNYIKILLLFIVLSCNEPKSKDSDLWSSIINYHSNKDFNNTLVNINTLLKSCPESDYIM